MREYGLQAQRVKQLSNLMKNGGKQRWFPEKDNFDNLTEEQNPTPSTLLLGLWFSCFGLSSSPHGDHCQLPCHISFTSALCHCSNRENRQLGEFPLLLPDIPLFTSYHFRKAVTLLSEVMETMPLRKLAVIYLSIVSTYHKRDHLLYSWV